MEGSTPAKKKGFGFRRKSAEKNRGEGHLSGKKKPRESFAVDANKDQSSTEQFQCEMAKPSEDEEFNQELQRAEKGSGKKFKKKHYRHFSFGGKFHKHKGKAPEVQEVNKDASGADCFGTETTGSSATQIPSNAPDGQNVNVQEKGTERHQEGDDEMAEKMSESLVTVIEKSSCETKARDEENAKVEEKETKGHQEGDNEGAEKLSERVESDSVTLQIADGSEMAGKSEEDIMSETKDESAVEEGEAESSGQQTEQKAVPLAEEENFEDENIHRTGIKGEKVTEATTTTTTMEEKVHHLVPAQSSQTEGDNIGGFARESEFQVMKKEEMEVFSSPTTENHQSNEAGESSHTAAEVELKFPTAADGKSIQPPEDDTSPISSEAVVQGQSSKEEADNSCSPGIGVIYQALLHVKGSLISEEKQSSIIKVSGIPYEICQLTVDTGRSKLSKLLSFVLGQAGYSTRHVLSYFVKILIQKYPHSFHVNAQGKRKRIRKLPAAQPDTVR